MLHKKSTALLLLTACPALADDAPEAHRVEVNGMQMCYETAGAGEPLIVLHGAT